MPAPLKIKPGTIIGANQIIEKDIELTQQKHRGYQKCKCLQCGNIHSVRTDNFKNKCKQCGDKTNKTHIQDDLTGRQFGLQTVINKANKPNYQTCKCKCGTIKDVFRGSLTQGISKSCGCVSSQGETQIIYQLNFYNINYKKEVCFKDLKTDKGGFPRFDFVIYDNDSIFCIIEYDGRQHNNYDKNQKMTKKDYDRLQFIDELKNNYCKEKNIPLYRFNINTNLENEISNIAKEMKKWLNVKIMKLI